MSMPDVKVNAKMIIPIPNWNIQQFIWILNYIPGCTSLTTVSAAAPTTQQSRTLLLQFLDLSDCTRISDAGLQSIARNTPHLQHLYLRRCLSITGEKKEVDASRVFDRSRPEINSDQKIMRQIQMFMSCRKIIFASRQPALLTLRLRVTGAKFVQDRCRAER